MKKLIGCSFAAGLAVMLSGCTMVAPPPQGGALNGWIYTDVSAPLWVTTNPGNTKSGTGSATSILGLVATGDASVQAAASSAGITKIHHVDYSVRDILHLWAKYTVTVYGE